MSALFRYLSVILFVTVLSACGGGSSSTSSLTPSSTSSPASSSTPSALTGLFVDAPVKGVSYSATPSGLSGTTDSAGTFHYQAGDAVSFSIPAGGGQSIPLGSIAPSAPSGGGSTVLSVLELPAGTQAATVLQTLNTATGQSSAVASGSAAPTLMDVSDLQLDPADITNLTAYINSKGSDLGSATSVVSMLQAAQSNATTAPNNTAPTFTVASTSLDTLVTNAAGFAAPASAVSGIGSLVDQLAASGQMPCSSSTCVSQLDQIKSLVASLSGSTASLSPPLFLYSAGTEKDPSTGGVLTGHEITYYSSFTKGATIASVGDCCDGVSTDYVYNVAGNTIRSLWDTDAVGCTPVTTTCSSDVVSLYSDPNGSGYAISGVSTDSTSGTPVVADIYGAGIPLESSLTLASLEGQAFTIDSVPTGVCGTGGLYTISVGASGAYQVFCDSSLIASGTARDGKDMTPAMPGMVLFTNSGGTGAGAMALVTGSIGAGSGTVALVSLNQRGNVDAFNGMYPFTTAAIPDKFSMAYLSGKTLYQVWFGDGQNPDGSLKPNVPVVLKLAFGTDGTGTRTALENYTDASGTYGVDSSGLLYFGGDTTSGNVIVCGSTSQYIKTHYLQNGAQNGVDLFFFNQADAMAFAATLTPTHDIPPCS